MAFLTIIAGLACGCWGLILALRGSVLVLSGLVLMVGAVFGSQWWQFDVSGVTLSLDRILLVVLVGSYLVQRKLGSSAPKPFGRAEYLLGGFLGLLVLNTFLHDWQRVAKGEPPIVPHLLEGYLVPALLYAVVRGSQIDARRVAWVYGLFAVFGIYLAATAVCEMSGAWNLVFPRFISDPRLGIHFGRARGPFLQSVRLGMYLLLALSMVWVPLVWRRSAGKQGLLLGLGLSALFVLAIYLTYTRSIWLSLAVGIVLVIAWTFTGAYRRAALFAVIAFAVTAVPLKDTLIGFKREYGAQETHESTRMRAVFAYVSWMMFQDRPLEGVGFGHFPHAKKDYLNDRRTTLHLESIRDYVHHNTWLSLLVELGLPGFLLYAALIITWGAQACDLWRMRDAPDWIRGQGLVGMIMVATASAQMLFHDVSYSPFENGALYITSGITAGIWCDRARFRTSSSRYRATIVMP